MRSVADVAVNGLDIAARKGIVLVNDDVDRWLCTSANWDKAIADLSVEACDDEDTAEAYARLCSSVRGPVATRVGTNRGEWRDLVGEAFAAGLIDEDDARAYGVEVTS